MVMSVCLLNGRNGVNVVKNGITMCTIVVVTAAVSLQNLVVFTSIKNPEIHRLLSNLYPPIQPDLVFMSHDLGL